MNETTTAASAAMLLDDWLDPLETALREGVHSYLRELLELEVTQVLGRLRYGRQAEAKGSRNGHRQREIRGTFGRLQIDVPRARIAGEDGRTQEFRSALLPRYQRLTGAALNLIASAYLAGVNTRRVRRALGSLFGGAVSKDTVSRAWRQVQTDFKAWSERSLEDEAIVRLILDGTVVKVRLDRKASSLSILVALGVRADGQKVLLGLRAMGGESEAAWRELLDGLCARGLRTPALVIVDGGKGLDAALAALWSAVPVQRCTVHKHRNLLAHAPKKLHDEIGADYTDMIYAKTVAEVQAKRKAFLRKWKLKCRAVADSLDEAAWSMVLSVVALLLKDLEESGAKHCTQEGWIGRGGGVIRRLAGDISLWCLGAIASLGSTVVVAAIQATTHEKLSGADSYRALASLVWLLLFFLGIGWLNVLVRREAAFLASEPRVPKWIRHSFGLVLTYGIVAGVLVAIIIWN